MAIPVPNIQHTSDGRSGAAASRWALGETAASSVVKSGPLVRAPAADSSRGADRARPGVERIDRKCRRGWIFMKAGPKSSGQNYHARFGPMLSLYEVRIIFLPMASGPGQVIKIAGALLSRLRLFLSFGKRRNGMEGQGRQFLIELLIFCLRDSGAFMAGSRLNRNFLNASSSFRMGVSWGPCRYVSNSSGAKLESDWWSDGAEYEAPIGEPAAVRPFGLLSNFIS